MSTIDRILDSKNLPQTELNAEPIDSVIYRNSSSMLISPSSDNSESSNQQSGKRETPAVVTQDFQFVSYSPGGKSKSKSSSSLSLIRSQAARHHWKQDFPSRTAQRADRGSRRKPKVQFVLVGVENSSDPSSESERSSQRSSNSPELPSIELLVGGARVDPFNSFPAKSKPYFTVAVDHCKLPVF
jgi:hypothetical protein